MALQTTTQLKKWFGTGCYPTGAQFADLIDSLRHKSDAIELSEVEGLCTALNDRADRKELVALKRAIEGLQTGVKALGYAVKDGGAAIIRFSGFVDGELGHPCTGRFTEDQVGDLLYHRTWQRFIEVVATDDWEYAEAADPIPGFFYVNEDALYIGVAGEDRNGLVEMTALLALAADVRDNVARSRVITLTRVADLRYSWSGAALGDIRQGDILTWTDADEMFRAVVFGERTSGTRRGVCAMFTRDGDEAIEFSLLWLYENGEAYETVFDSSQTLAGQFAACQNKLTDTADIQVRAEARPSGQHYTPYGLYLKGAAKRAVFNDMFNLEGNISNRTHSARPVTAKYDPENAPDASHPYWCNKIWLTYEEAVDAYNHRLTPSVSPAGAIRQCGPLRTVICSLHTIWGEKLSFSSTFRGLSELEVARLSTNDVQGVWVSNMQGAFQGCLKLKEIIPAIIDSTDSSLSWNVAFADCAELESFQIKGLRHNLNLKWSPKLSLATMQYLVDNASTEITAENPVVVTVHADVFAKLTGDCDGVTMVITAPTTRDKSAVPIVIANPGMFAVSDILTAPGITGDDGLPLRLTVTAVDAEGQPCVAPINAGALGGLSGCNIMLADSELAQWAAVLNAAYEKNISFATD